jgi:hypothetical protein
LGYLKSRWNTPDTVVKLAAGRDVTVLAMP